MGRLGVGLVALVIWAISSAFLFFVCMLSVNQTIISAALVAISICLVVSAILLVLKRDTAVLFVAAGPGFIVGAILMVGIVMNSVFLLRPK